MCPTLDLLPIISVKCPLAQAHAAQRVTGHPVVQEMESDTGLSRAARAAAMLIQGHLQVADVTTLVTRRTSQVTHRMSHVTRHTSHVTRHTSHVTHVQVMQRRVLQPAG